MVLQTKGIVVLNPSNPPAISGDVSSIPLPDKEPAGEPILLDSVLKTGMTSLCGECHSIPSGGKISQVLTKMSDISYDVDWTDVNEEIPEDTTINRDSDGLISSIVTATKTTAISRDSYGLISSINDGTYKKDILRTDGLISGIDVTPL